MSGHSHHHHHLDPDAPVSRIRMAFFLNFVFTIVELVGGILTQSMAITADAIHDLGDTFALGLALALQKKATNGADPRMTYGYKRLSLLSALISSGVLLVGSIFVLVKTIPSLIAGGQTPHVEGMLGLAVLGVAVNGLAAMRLAGGHTHNEKMLSLHMMEDLLGWVAVLIGAVILQFWELPWLDPLLAILISCFILWNLFKGMRSTIGLFLQAVPDVDWPSIEKSIDEIPGLSSLNSYHAWSLDGNEHVFTCQVSLDEGSDAIAVKDGIRHRLREQGFIHVTIEVQLGEHDGCHET